MPKPAWDVLVAGAGPSGATAARILAGRGLRVAMADRLDRPCRRLEMVSPSLRPLLAGLQLADLLADPSVARPCLGIRRRWGAAPPQIDDFLAHRGGEGHVVDRERLDAALRNRARAAGAVFLPLRIAGIERVEDGFRARFSDGGAAHAGRIVDATGRPAALARRLGGRRICRDRLAATIEERREGPRCEAPAWLTVSGEERGWRYTVEGPGGRVEAWSISAAGPSAGGRREDASAARLDRAAGEGWVAIGDAAAAFDPVTSQGLANALSTAAVAAGMIVAGDCGSAAGALYADAVTATFERSEAARYAVYAALRPEIPAPAASPPAA